MVIPAHLWRKQAQVECFPTCCGGNDFLPNGWCIAVLLPEESWAAASMPLFEHKEEKSSKPGQLSDSLSKSRYARDPWKGSSMSDIWLKHAVLQPSSASVWSPEYHCQLGSNLHWAWESGTLAVSLMVSSSLLHWFQICSYLELFISPAWHPFRQTQGKYFFI